MHLPGGIPSSLLTYLPLIHLPRPMTDRLELLTLLLSRSEAYAEQPPPAANMELFFHATRAQICDGLERMSQELRFPLSHRRTTDVGTFVRYLLDFPDEHRGQLGGLVRKAIRWHNEHGWEQDFDEFEEPFDAATPTKLPPIPLPTVEGVQFLQTVGDVLEEGKRMNHCIASYADRAVTGHCFLFHVDHEGECASVEVDLRGGVRQACGPSNRPNRATEYAARLLKHWGRDIKAVVGDASSSKGISF